MRHINLTPAQGGWMVEADGLAAVLMFFSGGEAEKAAKALGRAVADSGEAVEVCIRLRDGRTAGRFIYPGLSQSRQTAALGPRRWSMAR